MGRTVLDAVYGLEAIAGEDPNDSATHSYSPTIADDKSAQRPKEYAQFISNREALKGAKFGLPWKRCWEFVPEDQKKVASTIFDAIAKAGGEVVSTDFLSVEDRIEEDGKWNWYKVSRTF